VSKALLVEATNHLQLAAEERADLVQFDERGDVSHHDVTTTPQLTSGGDGSIDWGLAVVPPCCLPARGGSMIAEPDDDKYRRRRAKNINRWVCFL